MEIKKYLPLMAGITFSTIFGFTFMFTKEGLEFVSIFHLLGFRFSLAAIGMTILKYIGLIKLKFKGKDLKSLFILCCRLRLCTCSSPETQDVMNTINRLHRHGIM